MKLLILLLIALFTAQMASAEVFPYEWNNPDFQSTKVEYKGGDIFFNDEKLKLEEGNYYVWERRNILVEIQPKGIILLSTEERPLIAQGKPKGEGIPFKYIGLPLP